MEFYTCQPFVAVAIGLIQSGRQAGRPARGHRSHTAFGGPPVLPALPPRARRRATIILAIFQARFSFIYWQNSRPPATGHLLKLIAYAIHALCQYAHARHRGSAARVNGSAARVNGSAARVNGRLKSGI